MIKYRSISFVGTNRYSFVKYTDKYQEQLAELRGSNPILADYVEQCPCLYSEFSDHQAYMIFRDETSLVGAIFIGTSCDEQNLEIQLHIDESKTSERFPLHELITQMIDSLSVYFYDKEYIEIDCINDIDLHSIRSLNCERIYYDPTKNTYRCKNAYHLIIPKLLMEMKQAEQTLLEWHQVWREEYDLDYYNFSFDEELMEGYEAHTIPDVDLFSKVLSVKWDSIRSNKSERAIVFGRQGDISFQKEGRGLNQRIYYNIDYRIMSNAFKLNAAIHKKEQSSKKLFIEDNRLFTLLQNDTTRFQILKEDGHKRVTYQSFMDHGTSIAMDMVLDGNQHIRNGNIYFRTHKDRVHTRRKSKINGTYALSFKSDWNSIRFRFLSRSGQSNYSFGSILKGLQENSFSQNEELTFACLDELIGSILLVMDRFALIQNKQKVSLNGCWKVREILAQEKEMIEFLKQINGEIPLPHLQGILEHFTLEYPICVGMEQDTKKRVKRRI